MYRRDFLTCRVAGAAIYGATNPLAIRQASAGIAPATQLAGSTQRLSIVKRTIEVNGRPRMCLA